MSGGLPPTVHIDISQAGTGHALRGYDLEGITFIEGDLGAPEIVAQVEQLAGERCLVIEDSAHTYETTAAALRNYARFVPPGGFLVVEDGCVDDEQLRLLDDWPRGVIPALKEWLQTPEGGAFTVRDDLELYGVTCHPGGFLQRVA